MSVSKIFVAGHKGMVGSAICRRLCDLEVEVITADRNEVDLTNQLEVTEYFSDHKITYIYIAAAKVGGIHANNNFPADFIYQNLMIQCNLIHSAHLSGIQKLLFLGSSCIYPKSAEQPMRESSLLTGPLEPTNEPYAIAKIAGIKMCESYNRQYGYDYRSVMPTNLYGSHDNFHPENSHVIPALLRRFHEAKKNNEPEIKIWGSGVPRREFLHVDDMALACVHVMNLEREAYVRHTEVTLSHINVGSGIDYSISELAELIKDVVGYKGNIVFDHARPDGTPKKLLNSELLSSLGWSPEITLSEGLHNTYEWFQAHQGEYRR